FRILKLVHLIERANVTDSATEISFGPCVLKRLVEDDLDAAICGKNWGERISRQGRRSFLKRPKQRNLATALGADCELHEWRATHGQLKAREEIGQRDDADQHLCVDRTP